MDNTKLQIPVSLSPLAGAREKAFFAEVAELVEKKDVTQTAAIAHLARTKPALHEAYLKELREPSATTNFRQ